MRKCPLLQSTSLLKDSNLFSYMSVKFLETQHKLGNFEHMPHAFLGLQFDLANVIGEAD